MSRTLHRRTGLAGILAFLLAGVLAPSFHRASEVSPQNREGFTGSRSSTAAHIPVDNRVLARQQAGSTGTRVSSDALAMPAVACSGDPRIPGSSALLPAGFSRIPSALSGAHLGRAPPCRG
jgi:hypothetical protein